MLTHPLTRYIQHASRTLIISLGGAKRSFAAVGRARGGRGGDGGAHRRTRPRCFSWPWLGSGSWPLLDSLCISSNADGS